MKCTSCGAEIKEGASFCAICGTPVPINNQAPVTNTTNNYNNYNNNVNIPPEYKPISMWGYIGYNFLFAIPLVGFILMIVFSCGGANNINVRNYARSYLCIIIICTIITIAIYVILFSLMGASALSMSEYM